jgi:hypothetical protein
MQQPQQMQPGYPQPQQYQQPYPQQQAPPVMVVVQQHQHQMQAQTTYIVKAPFSHGLHIVLDIFTCGAWIPIHLICWAIH